MAVATYTMAEITSSVPPARLFKALCTDNHNLLPKLMPESVKSIEVVQGDAHAAGCIKKLNFADGSPYKYLKHRIDELDEKNFYCKYTTIEGDVLGDKLEYVVNESKLEPNGTSTLCKMTCHYHLKAGATIEEGQIKIGKEKIKEMFEKVEGYLLANPKAYA